MKMSFIEEIKNKNNTVTVRKLDNSVVKNKNTIRKQVKMETR